MKIRKRADINFGIVELAFLINRKKNLQKMGEKMFQALHQENYKFPLKVYEMTRITLSEIKAVFKAIKS